MSPKVFKYLSILLIVALVNSQELPENENDVPSETDNSFLDDLTTTKITADTDKESSTTRLVLSESSTTPNADNGSSTTKPQPTTTPIKINNGIDFSGNKSSITFELNQFRPVFCTPAICLHRCLSVMDPPVKATCSERKTCTCLGDDEKMDIKIEEEA